MASKPKRRNDWRTKHEAAYIEIESGALQANQFSAAATARRNLERIDEQRTAADEAAEVYAITDPLERAERQVLVYMRNGSYVAAEQASRRADELRRLRAAEEVEAANAALLHQSDDEVHAVLVETIHDMPHTLIRDLHATLAAHPAVAGDPGAR